MRRYGLLLHISSLPSAWGIGDLGPAAHAFADSLAQAGASVWQFLPLNPTSSLVGNSPYSSNSAFAGNPLLISPELLVSDGFLSRAELEASLDCLPDRCIGVDPARVNYEAVTLHRQHLLGAAFERFRPRLGQDADFQTFCREHNHWLHDYARFVSLKQAHGSITWAQWPAPLRLRDPEALADWDHHAALPIVREKFIQYLFFSQWMRLRAACARRGILLLADLPIYVTHDSADVWAHPQYFKLDGDMQPAAVSGVPPDYFSKTGQRWDNPVYRWEVLERDGFSWWKQRLAHMLRMADKVRLDHFRGFCAYWEVPAGEESAANGEWKPAPARAFFTSLSNHFHCLPFLAEDLGVITDDVRAVMAEFGLPGMHVLQFAFGGAEPANNTNIPHRHAPASFVYTGTHDNAPSRAWFKAASERERENFARYAGYSLSEETATAALAHMAFASVSSCAIVPMQDALNLGEEARMNTPAIATGNWTWRMTESQAKAEHLAWLRRYAHIYGRLAGNSGSSLIAPDREI